MTVSPSALATTIAALSVTVTKPDGTTATLNIRDLGDTGPAIYDRDCPVMYPRYQYATGRAYERQSVGADPFWQVTWMANYYYAHAPVGSGRYNGEHSEKIAANATAIAEAIAAACTTLGVSEVSVSDVSDPTIVSGPDESQFYGAEISLAITDYRNL